MAGLIRSICSALRYPLDVFADGVCAVVWSPHDRLEQARQAVPTRSGS